MASANVEFVRSLFAAWERGDFSAGEWVHPDVEWTVADGNPVRGWAQPTRGKPGRSQLTAWQNLRFRAEDYSELDGERVLVQRGAYG